MERNISHFLCVVQVLLIIMEKFSESFMHASTEMKERGRILM